MLTGAWMDFVYDCAELTLTLIDFAYQHNAEFMGALADAGSRYVRNKVQSKEL